jgi:hypothetical protein
MLHMIEAQLLAPAGLLATRLLVPDAAGLVSERLQAQGLAPLGAAFRSHGPGGRALLERLPELDAWLEAVAEAAGQVEPAAGSVQVQLAEELDGLFEITGDLPPMPFRPCPPRFDPEFTAAVTALAAGLVLGVALLDERATDPLELPHADLDGVLAALEGRRLDLGVLTSVSAAKVALELVEVVERLIGLDDRLGLQLRALRSLATVVPRPARVASVRRMHLLAGLVGAGVVVPPQRRGPRGPRRPASVECAD